MLESCGMGSLAQCLLVSRAVGFCPNLGVWGPWLRVQVSGSGPVELCLSFGVVLASVFGSACRLWCASLWGLRECGGIAQESGISIGNTAALVPHDCSCSCLQLEMGLGRGVPLPQP